MFSKEQLRQQSLDKAVKFLHTKYKSPEAQEVLNTLTIDDIHWSTTCRFGKMRHNGARKFLKNDRNYETNRKKPIRIQEDRKRWISYERKTVGITANIKCSNLKAIEIQLVHEITHLIQYAENRKFGEVETTQNEIDYVDLLYPELLKKVATT